MPFTDHEAANQLRNLREDRGLSREALAKEIQRVSKAKGWYKLHGAVDAFTIRRIERDGHCPSERVRLVIALYFDVPVRELWRVENRYEVEVVTCPT